MESQTNEVQTNSTQTNETQSNVTTLNFTRNVGQVKWFSAAKGFGFIHSLVDNKDYDTIPDLFSTAIDIYTYRRHDDNIYINYIITIF